MNNTSSGKGFLFAVFAYILWGALPVYWKLLASVPSLHILGFRIVFSLLLVSAVLFYRRNISWLKFYKDRRQTLMLTLGAFMLSFNWGLYIWAVNSGHTIEAAVGYYINPLVSVVLGLIFFKEKLKTMQWIAFALAMTGVLILTIFSGAPPWISLGLALSFGFYGLIKKTVSLSALESLGAETLIAAPLGLLMLFSSLGNDGQAVYGLQGLSYLPELPAPVIALLLGCGAVTTLPLYLFSNGAKMLPLTTMGFIQFLAPSITFLEGVFIFHETFPPRNFIVFGCIWAAVILYIVSLKIAARIPKPGD
ncbi:MAG: EamA family transporter RarD [Treponema sp.]|jgi:chloramphenicol-sensitive protein RarD|nr:EamA family transporter RarD [Treponema sp.]